MTSGHQQGTVATPADAVVSATFQENAAKIYGFIYAKVGNGEVAKDLISQVFLKATRWLVQDRRTHSIRCWIFTTARSTIVIYWREQRQQGRK